MAKVMKCDRCGKIYEVENSNIGIVVQHATGSRVCYYDLCPGCAEHFRFDFMGSENNENERRINDENMGRKRS